MAVRPGEEYRSWDQSADCGWLASVLVPDHLVILPGEGG